MPINAVLKQTYSADDRSADRFRLQLQATGSNSEAGSADIVVQDLSATGFLIQTDYPFVAGETLSLDIPGAGTVVATLVWNSGRYFGGEFSQTLSRDSLNGVLAASKVVGPNFRATSADGRGAGAEASFEVLETRSTEPRVEQKLPLHRRGQIIVTTSLLLWSGIAAAGWAALS